MAKVTFQHIGSMSNISPGSTHHWWWNNAPDERVWSISVDPNIPLRTAFAGSSARLEVTRVEYRQNYDGQAFEREIHFWVKNTGSVGSNYLIHMATIRD